MIRLAVRMLLTVLANAVGLLAAAFFLEDFTIDSLAFVIAVLIFTASTTILGPFIAKMALKNADYLMGGIALVNTLVALVLTDIFSSGISINGVSTWVLATLIVWVFSIIGNLLLPLVLFKKTMEKVKEDKST